MGIVFIPVFYMEKQSKRHSRKPQWTSILCQFMYMNNTSNCNTDYIGSTRIINQYIHYLITCISLQLFRSLFWIAYFFYLIDLTIITTDSQHVLQSYRIIILHLQTNEQTVEVFGEGEYIGPTTIQKFTPCSKYRLWGGGDTTTNKPRIVYILSMLWGIQP